MGFRIPVSTLALPRKPMEGMSESLEPTQPLTLNPVPINSILGFIIRTYKEVGLGRLVKVDLNLNRTASPQPQPFKAKPLTSEAQARTRGMRTTAVP